MASDLRTFRACSQTVQTGSHTPHSIGVTPERPRQWVAGRRCCFRDRSGLNFAAGAYSMWQIV